MSAPNKNIISRYDLYNLVFVATLLLILAISIEKDRNPILIGIQGIQSFKDYYLFPILWLVGLTVIVILSIFIVIYPKKMSK